MNTNKGTYVRQNEKDIYDVSNCKQSFEMNLNIKCQNKAIDENCKILFNKNNAENNILL